MPPKINIYYYWVPSKPPTTTAKLCEESKMSMDIESRVQKRHSIQSIHANHPKVS